MTDRIYNLNESIVFRKTTAAYGGLSNMASGYSLYVNEIIIPSVEHLYQAMRYTAYPDIQAIIIAQNNAMKAKMVSNKYKKEFSRKDWGNIQVKVMRWALGIKLSQNWDKFSTLLASTGTKSIVEYTPTRKFWGAVQIGNELKGVNALGRLLMELRQNHVLKNDQLFSVEPLLIKDFQLFDYPIGSICDDNYYEQIDTVNDVYDYV